MSLPADSAVARCASAAKPGYNSPSELGGAAGRR
jgi:hypothetical protein